MSQSLEQEKRTVEQYAEEIARLKANLEGVLPSKEYWNEEAPVRRCS